MQKILIVILLLAGFACANAQSTSPRFGTAKNQDNTGRTLTYAYISAADAAGPDTVKTTPGAYTTYYRLTGLADSVGISITSTALSYAGDNITVIASGSSGSFVKFIGGNWVSAGKATLSTNGRAVIKFVFDGAAWVEASRVVQ